MVVSHGTQHNPGHAPHRTGGAQAGAGTLAVTGDLKHMSPQWLRGASFTGYGVTLTVGLGIPIPILDEEILEFVAVTDADIIAPGGGLQRGLPQRQTGGPGGSDGGPVKSPGRSP